MIAIVAWAGASLITGFVLGKAIQICEVNECANNSKTMTPQYAPGAEWGTWSPTTADTDTDWEW